LQMQQNEEVDRKSCGSKGVPRSDKKINRSNSNECKVKQIELDHINESSEIGKLGSKTFEILADSNADGKITVGVCCMEKKLNSKPMQNILEQLGRYPDMLINQFKEDMILN